MNLKENIQRIKKVMGIINEIMIPNTNPSHENDNVNYTVIAQDDTSNDFLLLIVELHEENDEHIFSYFFQVFSEQGEPVTKRLYKREDVFNYLPEQIKPSILPLVKKMLIQLVNRINPNIINRTSMELLNDKTMKRFNEISDLLQNELNYELIWSGKDDEGKNVWRFKKNDMNSDLTEETIENFYRFNSERIKNVLVEAEKITNNLIKDNWVEHRLFDKKINNKL